MKVILHLLLLTFVLGGVNAQNHLEPLPSLLEADSISLCRESTNKAILYNTLSPHPIARLIVQPTFSPTYIISLERHEQYYGNCLIYQKPYRKAENIEYIRITCSIDSEDSDLISDLFESALLQTRYRNDDIVFVDGTRYNFINRTMSGFTRKEARGEEIEKLVAICDEITSLLLDNTHTQDAKLEFSHNLRQKIINLTMKFR